MPATVFTNFKVAKYHCDTNETLYYIFTRSYQMKEVPHHIGWKICFVGTHDEIETVFTSLLGRHFDEGHALCSYIYTTNDLRVEITKLVDRAEPLSIGLLKSTGYDLYRFNERDFSLLTNKYDVAGGTNGKATTRVVFDEADIHQLTRDILDIKNNDETPRHWFASIQSDHQVQPST